MRLNTPSDEEIMAQVAQGELDLLKLLFDRHHKHIFNFLLQMCGDRMLSEDLTQEVFYKVMRYRESYNHGKFVSWLFAIARNTLKTHFSKSRTTDRDFNTVANQWSEKADSEREDYSDLQRALGQLDDSDREVLVLNRLQEVRYEELALILNSTPGAVKTKVCRALKKLKHIYVQQL
ncbi:MAG: RNA polymerase sigma factor [Bacteroidota bacterium]